MRIGMNMRSLIRTEQGTRSLDSSALRLRKRFSTLSITIEGATNMNNLRSGRKRYGEAVFDLRGALEFW
jgi:hypothetical protein